MKKPVLLILCLILISCSSVKINAVGKTIVVNSGIEEKVSLVKAVFKQSNRGLLFNENSLLVVFKNVDLRRNNFEVSFVNYDNSGSNSFLLGFDSAKKLNSFVFNDYDVEIYDVTSKLIQFQDFKENFKYIVIKRKENDLLIVSENVSDFEDNVSGEFLLAKFNELKFRVK